MTNIISFFISSIYEFIFLSEIEFFGLKKLKKKTHDNINNMKFTNTPMYIKFISLPLRILHPKEQEYQDLVNFQLRKVDDLYISYNLHLECF